MKNILIPATIAIILMAGCERKEETELPEVNRENCVAEKIKKMPDKSMREELAGECARNGPGLR